MTNYDDAFSTRPFTLRLIVSTASQNIAANTSTVNWTLRVIRTGGYESYSTSGNSFSVKINGSTRGSGSWTYDFRGTSIGDYENIDSGSYTITHNADGTKSASIAISATGSSIGSASKSGTYTLATIPRASTPTFDVGGVDVTSIEAGNAVDINMNRASSSFTHDVSFTFGTQSGTIDTSVATETSWTPPLSLLSEIPSANSGAANITVDTYNGATLIGSKTVTLTLTVPTSAEPDFTTVTNTEATTSPNVASIVGAYVKGLSTIAVAITGATGAYGSTIVSYKIEVVDSGGLVTQTINASSGTTGVIQVSGAIKLRGTVVDTRGISHVEDVNITVMSYALPAITAATAVRANSGGTVTPAGTYIRVDLTAAVQSLVVGTQKNNLTYTIKTKPTGGSYTTVSGPTSAGSTGYSNHVTVGTYSIASSFVVRVEITDALGSLSYAELTVATGGALMHFSKTNDAIGVGKYWQQGSVDALLRMYQQNGQKVIDESDLATSTVVGVIKKADNSITITGTATDTAVTPASLAAWETAKAYYRPGPNVYFTSSGTFSKASYPGLKAVRIKLVGGGGGGGGMGSNRNGAGGGGGAGYSEKLVLVATLGSSETVTVGAGGTAGPAANAVGSVGGTGGTSSVGSLCSATGGLGGSYITGGAPGVGSSGDLNISGAGGGWGSRDYAGSTAGGAGGSSMLGGGGQGQGPTGAGNVGSTGGNYGGGGGGAWGNDANRAGGAGAPGIVIMGLMY